ncbi:MAG: hypothetical protein ACRDZX_12675, partial [Acidimicrobiales bacterium]
MAHSHLGLATDLAAIVDPASGGHFSLRPVGKSSGTRSGGTLGKATGNNLGAYRPQRRYLPGANVLETVYSYSGA